MKLKNPDGPPSSKGKAPASTKKPASKAKIASKKRKKGDDDVAAGDDDGEVRGDDEEPKRRKTRAAPASRGKPKASEKVVEKVVEENAEEEQMDEDEGNGIAKSSDELAEINGVKPKVYLKDGAEQEVSSMSRCVSISSWTCVSLIAPPVHPRTR
jgi:DNA ligase-1